VKRKYEQINYSFIHSYRLYWTKLATMKVILPKVLLFKTDTESVNNYIIKKSPKVILRKLDNNDKRVDKGTHDKRSALGNVDLIRKIASTSSLKQTCSENKQTTDGNKKEVEVPMKTDLKNEVTAVTGNKSKTEIEVAMDIDEDAMKTNACPTGTTQNSREEVRPSGSTVTPKVYAVLTGPPATAPRLLPNRLLPQGVPSLPPQEDTKQPPRVAAKPRLHLPWGHNINGKDATLPPRSVGLPQASTMTQLATESANEATEKDQELVADYMGKDKEGLKIRTTKTLSKVVLSKLDRMQPSINLFKKDKENVVNHLLKNMGSSNASPKEKPSGAYIPVPGIAAPKKVYKEVQLSGPPLVHTFGSKELLSTNCEVLHPEEQK